MPRPPRTFPLHHLRNTQCFGYCGGGVIPGGGVSMWCSSMPRPCAGCGGVLCAGCAWSRECRYCDALDEGAVQVLIGDYLEDVFSEGPLCEDRTAFGRDPDRTPTPPPLFGDKSGTGLLLPSMVEEEMERQLQEMEPPNFAVSRRMGWPHEGMETSLSWLPCNMADDVPFAPLPAESGGSLIAGSPRTAGKSEGFILPASEALIPEVSRGCSATLHDEASPPNLAELLEKAAQALAHSGGQ